MCRNAAHPPVVPACLPGEMDTGERASEIAPIPETADFSGVELTVAEVGNAATQANGDDAA
ncbi:hypothetical protein GCM10009565_39720 [Amycolatopsis albidoflavus]